MYEFVEEDLKGCGKIKLNVLLWAYIPKRDKGH